MLIFLMVLKWALQNYLTLISTDFNYEDLNSKAECGYYVSKLHGKNICIEVNNSWKTSSYDNVNDRSYENATTHLTINIISFIIIFSIEIWISKIGVKNRLNFWNSVLFVKHLFFTYNIYEDKYIFWNVVNYD